MFVSMEQVKMTRRLMKRGRCEFPDIYDRQEILSRWFQEEEFECARTPAVKLLGEPWHDPATTTYNTWTPVKCTDLVIVRVWFPRCTVAVRFVMSPE